MCVFVLFAMSQNFSKNIYYCGQNPGKIDITSMVSNEENEIKLN